MLKKFLAAVETHGEKFLREDGFFFVTLLILNTPIISFAEDFQVAFVNFYLGAFAIFLVAATVNFLFQKLPRVKKFIQAVVIILFAVQIRRVDESRSDTNFTCHEFCRGERFFA